MFRADVFADEHIYSGLNLQGADSILFEYRILGIDDTWRNVTQKTTKRISELPARNYTLQLRARTMNDDIWSHNSMEITIKPPFWKNPFFIFIVIVFIGVFLWLFRRYEISKKFILRQVVKEKNRAVENERQRISRDFHDGIGTSLSQISISSEVASNKILNNDFDGTIKELNFISDCTQEIMEMLRDIIWAMDPAKNQIEDLLINIRYNSARILQSRGIKLSYSSSIKNEKRIISAEFKKNVYFIAKEAIMNVCKHSQASVLEITTDIKDGNFILLMADNGDGFCLDGKDGYPQSGKIGLKNMEERAKEIGGEMNIEEKSGSGTSIEIIIPLPPTELYVR